MKTMHRNYNSFDKEMIRRKAIEAYSEDAVGNQVMNYYKRTAQK
jgi:hypothetical protein